MQVNTNRATNQVAGVNTLASILDITINVRDDFNLSKMITEVSESTENLTEEVQRVVNFKENPHEFSLEEIVNAKYKDILEASSNDYIIADIFLDENDLDLSDPQHSANTGYGILQLLPNGEAVTRLINLEAPATLFNLLEFDADSDVEIYINNIKFTENKATFTEPISSFTIKFLNTTNKPKMVRAYAIGY